MKTDKEYSDTIKREVEVDVDALLAAINEISESEVRRSDDNQRKGLSHLSRAGGGLRA